MGSGAHGPCALDKGLMLPEEQNLHPWRAQRRPAVVISLTPLNEMLAVVSRVKINTF